MAKSPKTKNHQTQTAPAISAVGTLPSREAILEAMADHPHLDGKRDLCERFRHPRRHAHALQGPAQGDGGRRLHRPHPQGTSAAPPTLPARHRARHPHRRRPRQSPRLPGAVERGGGRETARDACWRPATPASCRRPATASSPASMPATATCPHYTAKAMKILDKPRRGQIGIVRMDEDGARLDPGRPQAEGNAHRQPAISATPATAISSKSRSRSPAG